VRPHDALRGARGDSHRCQPSVPGADRASVSRGRGQSPNSSKGDRGVRIGGRTTLPINLEFGRSFGRWFVGSVGVEYTHAGRNEDDVRALTSLAFRLP
jgi:hypothetical protein